MANVTSSIQLKRHTGSLPVRPLILNEGEFAIDFADRGHLYYGTNDSILAVSSSFTFDDLTLSSSKDFALAVSGATKLQGDLTVEGTASFDVLVTNYESASIIYTSGSTKFGDSYDDTHVRTGSMLVSGNMIVSGNVEGITASFGEYIGVNPTFYKTGSAAIEDLLQLDILNFDSNVFITSDPNTGRLTLQFGEANLPTNTFSRSGFNTDRFSLQEDNYTITSTWDTVDSVTYLSHSFLVHIGGTTQLLGTSLDLTSTNPGTHTLNINDDSFPIYSGSYGGDGGIYSWKVTSSLRVQDGAGTYQDILSNSGTSLVLNKTEPSQGTMNSLTGINASTINNLTSRTANSQIEQGSSGTIQVFVIADQVTNFWKRKPIEGTSIEAIKDGGVTSGGGASWDYNGNSASFSATVATASSLSSLDIYVEYTSSTGANPGSSLLGFPSDTTVFFINSKAYNRVLTPRVGFSANSSSLLEVDFNALNNWLDGSEIEDGQVINFPTANPNNVTFTADVTSTDKYLYIVYASGQSNLTQIIQSNQNVIDQFNSPVTVGDYKYYRSINKVVAPNTFTAELKTT